MTALFTLGAIAKAWLATLAMMAGQGTLLMILALVLARAGKLRPAWQAAIWLVVTLKLALSIDGTLAVRMSANGTPENAADLGARLATDMLAEGAADLAPAEAADGRPEAPAEPVRRQNA